MRVIVCGGRNFKDMTFMDAALSAFHRKHPLELVITGDGEGVAGAPGADLMAYNWATANGIHTARVHALWDTHRLAAGPVRNGVLLTLDAEAVIAFPGGKGTQDMVRQAEAEGLPIWKPRREQR